MNIHQYIVTLMNIKDGILNHIVNCANEDQAKGICEGIFSGYRVINIAENV